MATEKFDFHVGDRVSEPKAHGHTKLRKVKSEPALFKDKWYMMVDDNNLVDFLVECENYVLIQRKEKNNYFKGVQMKLSKPAIWTGALLGVLLLVGVMLGGNYNSLNLARNGVDQSWSNVETQYQRRFDLLGNLVDSAKSSQGQEQKVFGDIAAARAGYQNATTTEGKAQAASQIETQVALLRPLQEAYPDLKSNVLLQNFMTENTGTENSIAKVRTDYNAEVTKYNNKVTSFPTNLLANMFGFKKGTLFKADSSAATAPKNLFK